MTFAAKPWKGKDNIEANAENAEYWEKEVSAWLRDNVTLGEPSVTAIAGRVVISLGDEWDRSHAKDLIGALYDAQFPVYKREGSDRIRIEGSSRRLNVSYV